MPIKAKIIAGKYLDSVNDLISRELRSLKGVLKQLLL